MDDHMHDFIPAHINRDYAVEQLNEILNKHARTPVEQTENAGYHIGKSLGYSDGLRDAIKLLREMQPEPPKESPRVWHHPW